jgi:plastocyanin
VRLAAAACAVAALLLPGLVPAAGASRSDPTRVQVVAMEFYYILSRHTVAAGPAIVQLVDFGQDPHDLRMQRIGGGRIYGTPIIQPGTIYDLSLTLLPGTYELWCSIANHRALGMAAKLVVKPASPAAAP